MFQLLLTTRPQVFTQLSPYPISSMLFMLMLGMFLKFLEDWMKGVSRNHLTCRKGYPKGGVCLMFRMRGFTQTMVVTLEPLQFLYRTSLLEYNMKRLSSSFQVLLNLGIKLEGLSNHNNSRFQGL